MSLRIHPTGILSCKRFAALGARLALSALLLAPARGTAQVVTLTNAGSTATIDLGGSAGMDNWTVNGQNQLHLQWFWYRTDAGLAQPVNTLGGLQYQVLGNNMLDALYQNGQLSVEIMYTLIGGGLNSASASLTEQIIVANLSGSAFDLNFYQYSDFDLLASANDNVQITGSPGNYNYVHQWNGVTAIEETATAPSAFSAEAALAGQTLNEFGTVSGLNLNGNLAAGPGNVTWAFQWTSTLGANGGEFDLTKSLSISVVPEPSPVLLVLCGALGLILKNKGRRP